MPICNKLLASTPGLSNNRPAVLWLPNSVARQPNHNQLYKTNAALNKREALNRQDHAIIDKMDNDFKNHANTQHNGGLLYRLINANLDHFKRGHTYTHRGFLYTSPDINDALENWQPNRGLRKPILLHIHVPAGSPVLRFAKSRHDDEIHANEHFLPRNSRLLVTRLARPEYPGENYLNTINHVHVKLSPPRIDNKTIASEENGFADMNQQSGQSDTGSLMPYAVPFAEYWRNMVPLGERDSPDLQREYFRRWRRAMDTMIRLRYPLPEYAHNDYLLRVKRNWSDSYPIE